MTEPMKNTDSDTDNATATLASPQNTILSGDCIAGMRELAVGTADLVFADPPFNIGYEYDIYQDRLACEQYLDWSREWIQAVHQVLKPEGTFWLAIGDEYAAELKIIAQEVGFQLRSWVIWYYTFGVNCRYKFSRSHAHLFYFAKDAKNYTFLSEELENRIPSARQLVYNDKRSNPQGRLPDDTWIIPPAPPVTAATWTLRPQDLDDCFRATEDTWYFPRVAGTFKERAGFHGCQMPEQLLARIIRSCSRPGELVLDPFSGSATTLAVAKKLGRRFLGFDLSEEYVQHGLARLAKICPGDRIEGAPEPLMSAPKTGTDKNAHAAKQKKNQQKQLSIWNNIEAREQTYQETQLELTIQGIREAFSETSLARSVESLLMNPALQQAFVAACRSKSLAGDPSTWNRLLWQLRTDLATSLAEDAEDDTPKPDGSTNDCPIGNAADCDAILSASEIALQAMQQAGKVGSFWELMCEPDLAARFDQLASRLSPGYAPALYRWGAHEISRLAPTARGRGSVLRAAQQEVLPRWFTDWHPLEQLTDEQIPAEPGLFLLRSTGDAQALLLAGETCQLRRRLSGFAWANADSIANDQHPSLSGLKPGSSVEVAFVVREIAEAGPLAWLSCLVSAFRPAWNYQELQIPGPAAEVADLTGN